MVVMYITLANLCHASSTLGSVYVSGTVHVLALKYPQILDVLLFHAILPGVVISTSTSSPTFLVTPRASNSSMSLNPYYVPWPGWVKSFFYYLGVRFV